jgi:quinoprotein glucose dehydrogenase
LHRYRLWAVLVLAAAVVVYGAFQVRPTIPSVDETESERPSEPKRTSAPREGELAIKKFKVPEGLKVELVAAEPQLANPVSFCFDELGRIYVAETYRLSAGALDINSWMEWLDQDLASRTVDDRVRLLKRNLGEHVKILTRNQDRIRRIDVINGKAVRSTVFADGFNQIADGIGAGVLARRRNVWYACIPNLWRFRDPQGLGKPDQKESLHYGYGVHISAGGHDLHGLRMGPDGKLYFSIGDRGLSVRTEGRTLSCPDCGAVLRCDPSGANLEIYATGLRNPQELAFDQYGNLFTCDNDADFSDKCRWVYIVPGGDFGWRLGYQFMREPNPGGPWMAEKLWEADSPTQAAYLLPPVANIGNGPAGLTYHPGVARLPERYRDHFFLADFVGTSLRSGVRTFTNRPKGASFELLGHELFWWSILSTDVDFGPDGALYVSDWVESFQMPNKGRIYRLQRSPAATDALVRETEALISQGMEHRSLTELAGLLGHADMRVRQEAQFALAEREPAAAVVLSEMFRPGKPRLARIHAIWALGQRGRRNPAALAPLLELLGDPDAEVRSQAAKVLGEARYARAGEKLLPLLHDDNPRVRFFAATALGQLAKPEAFQPILQMLRENGDKDSYLRHAGVMGLVGTGRGEALHKAANDSSVAVRKGVLLAMRRLESPEIARFLDDPEPSLRLEAARTINDVPISAALAQLATLAARPGLPEAVLYRVLNANFRGGEAKNAAAIAGIVARAESPGSVRVEGLRELSAWANPSGRDRVMGLWRPLTPRSALPAAVALQSVLRDVFRAPDDVQREAARAVAQLGVKEAGPLLFKLVGDQKAAPMARVEALRALDTLKDGRLDEATKVALADAESQVRNEGRRVLVKLRPGAAVSELKAVFETGSLAEQQAALSSLGNMNSREGDKLLEQQMDALLSRRAPLETELDILEAAAHRTTPVFQKKLKEYEASRPKDDPLAAYRESLAGGNLQAGRKIFFEKPQVACLRCHKVNEPGGDVGPDLSAIGRTKDRRYLLESIVDPNKQIAEGFQTVVVLLRDGKSLTGVFKKDDGRELTLITAEAQLLTVPKADIEEQTHGPSAMPADLIKHLSKRELRDLVEFLASLKGPAPATDKAATWPQWRGPNRDGNAQEVRLPHHWPAKAPAPLWRAAVGEGFSSPVVAGGRLYIMGSESPGKETCFCLDAATGDTIWKHVYAISFKPFPGATAAGTGPKSTPTVDGDRVYTLGISGMFHCLDAQTGRVFWKHDFAAEYWGVEKDKNGADQWATLCGAAASPLVNGDQVILPVGGKRAGGMTAFDKHTGKLVWKSLEDRSTYASPMAVDLAGVRQVIGFTGVRMAGFDAANGKLLWDYPFKIDWDDTVVTPVVNRDLVLVGGGDQPTTALRIEGKSGKVQSTVAWRNKNLRCTLTTPVIFRDHLYGVGTNGRLVCLELATGKTLWVGGDFGRYVSLAIAGDQLLVLTEAGELHVIEPTPAAFTLRGRLQLSDQGATWSSLAIADNRLYVKDKRNVLCFEFISP